MIGAILLGAALSLNGDWSARFWPTPTLGPVRELVAIPGSAQSIPGKVPGCIELDLVAAGLVPDLLFSTNSLAMRVYEGHQWCYSRKFVCPKLEPEERAVLCFGGLDTLADVFVNGKKVGEAANMFIPQEFDVTGVIRSHAENEVAVLFRSVVMESQRGTVGVIGNAGVSGGELENVRKPAHMGGWDILPRMISTGIFRDCALEIRKPERVKDAFYVLQNLDLEKRRADYFVDIRLEGRFERLDSSEVVVTLYRNGTAAATARQDVIHWFPRVFFRIDEVEPWWPRGFGEPVLYEARVEWIDRRTGKTIADDVRKIGVKRIEFHHGDYVDKDHPGEFLFVVNGKPCFIRGTNWVPTDPLPVRAAQRTIPTLEYVKELNCNMIRVWGGGLYEQEPFWDWCDENGVMVWQDFMMACTMLPQNDRALQDEIAREVKSVVVRLRNHASLALWAGNNENDSVLLNCALSAYRPDPNRDVISRRIIPDILYEFDPTHPYMPSSPYISPDVVAGKAQMVEWHYYRRWWKSPLMTESPVRFSSELGYHGVPCRRTLERIFPPESVYPWTSPAESNRLWKTELSAYRPETDLNSGAEAKPATPPDPNVFVWNAEWRNRTVVPYLHYENAWYFPGRLDRALLQIGMLFDKVELDLDDFIEQSQITQAEAMKFLMEFYRSRKFNGRNGMCWWNVREGWPTITESFVDYFGERKRAFHQMKVAQRDRLAMIDERGGVLFVSDTLDAASGEVLITDSASEKVLFRGAGEFPANGVARVGSVSLEGQGVALIEYTVGGRKFHSHYLYGKPPFRFEEVRRWLDKSKEYRDD